MHNSYDNTGNGNKRTIVMDRGFNKDINVATFSVDEIDRILHPNDLFCGDLHSLDRESSFGAIKDIINPSLGQGSSNHGNSTNKMVGNDVWGVAPSHMNNQLLPSELLQLIVKQRGNQAPSHGPGELNINREKTILPKDLFRNRFTWSCYEIFKYRLPWAVSSLCVLLGWTIFKLNVIYQKVLVSAIIAGILFGCALIIPIFAFQFYRFHNSKELAKNVLELNPGFDIDKWEAISCTLNNIFYLRRIWGTPYFFFDGQHARQVFRENVLKLYLKGKSNDMNEIQSSKIYLQSIRRTFRYDLKEDLPQLASELELPREAHKSRFLSNPGYRLIGLFMCLFQGQIIFYLLTSFLQRSFQPGTLVLMVHNSFYLVCFLRICVRLVYPRMSILQGVKFLAVITRVAPGKSLDKWDEIARYMNQYFADEGTLNYGKFFDGKQCLEFYKKYFEPLSVGNTCLEYGDLIEIIKLTQPYVDSY